MAATDSQACAALRCNNDSSGRSSIYTSGVAPSTGKVCLSPTSTEGKATPVKLQSSVSNNMPRKEGLMRELTGYVKGKITDYNVFQNALFDTDSTIVREGRFKTRIFLPLFLISLLCYMIAYSFIEVVRIETIVRPSLQDIRMMESIAVGEPICPCSTTSDPYKFISMNIPPQLVYNQPFFNQTLSRLNIKWSKADDALTLAGPAKNIMHVCERIKLMADGYFMKCIDQATLSPLCSDATMLGWYELFLQPLANVCNSVSDQTLQAFTEIAAGAYLPRQLLMPRTLDVHVTEAVAAIFQSAFKRISSSSDGTSLANFLAMRVATGTDIASDSYVAFPPGCTAQCETTYVGLHKPDDVLPCTKVLPAFFVPPPFPNSPFTIPSKLADLVAADSNADWASLKAVCLGTYALMRYPLVQFETDLLLQVLPRLAATLNMSIEAVAVSIGLFDASTGQPISVVPTFHCGGQQIDEIVDLLPLKPDYYSPEYKCDGPYSRKFSATPFSGLNDGIPRYLFNYTKKLTVKVVEPDYDSYFAACAPSACTYVKAGSPTIFVTISAGFSVASTITMAWMLIVDGGFSIWQRRCSKRRLTSSKSVPDAGSSSGQPNSTVVNPLSREW